MSRQLYEDFVDYRYFSLNVRLTPSTPLNFFLKVILQRTQIKLDKSLNLNLNSVSVSVNTVTSTSLRHSF